MTRRSAAERGEVHGNFAAYPLFDAAVPPRHAAVCGAPNDRTRRIQNVTRRVFNMARRNSREGRPDPVTLTTLMLPELRLGIVNTSLNDSSTEDNLNMICCKMLQARRGEV
ncbi:hypothetical protein B0H17DRAFT_1149741 [Mycena rosella]|uniref:Uncharacterized protein n=1 Tax=Mycena rosella TaxID=1033263 RepID=A0AAD7FRE8_MYCRO|nr:hypothetical protein B0H17DRAFT_1149741 [Mycena rosella]